MKNGRADHDDEEPNDPKIARLEDERRRRQLGIGEKKRGAASSKPARPSVNARDWVIGGIILAMAVAGIASFASSAMKSLGVLPK